MEVVTNQKGRRTLLLDRFAYTTQRLVLIQATAGSSRPRKRKRYEALNTRIGNLIDNYAHTEIGHFLRGIAHDVEIHIDNFFFFFSLQVLRQLQHIAHNVRHSDFHHFHCRHFDISTFWLRHCDCRHFHCRHFDSAPTILKVHMEQPNWTELNWYGLVFDELTSGQAGRAHRPLVDVYVSVVT